MKTTAYHDPNTTPDPITENQRNGPSGIGGWLLLLVVGMMVLGPLSGAGRIFGEIGVTENNFPSLVSDPDWSAYKSAMGWAFAGVAALSVFGGWRLTSNKEWSAVQQATIILWVTGPVAAFVLGWIIPRLVFGEASFEDVIGPIAATSIAAGTWTIYLRKSVRVHNTYSPAAQSTSEGVSKKNGSPVQMKPTHAVSESAAFGSLDKYAREALVEDDVNAPKMFSENALYEIAWKETEIGRVHRGLWAKAYSICDGQKEKTRAFYIRERAKDLAVQQDERAKVFREQKRAEEKEKEVVRIKEVTDRLDEMMRRAKSLSEEEVRVRLQEKGYSFSQANMRDASDRTPLMDAALKDDRDAVLLLLLAGADHELRSPFGKTASQVAKERNNNEVVYIIDSFSWGGDWGRPTTVHPAPVSQRVEVDDRSDVPAKSIAETKRDSCKNKYLKYCELSKKEIVQRLNQMKYAVHGSLTVDLRDGDDKTGLMRAAEYGDEEAVLLLLTLGADKNSITKRGETATMLARTQKKERVAELIEGFEV